MYRSTRTITRAPVLAQKTRFFFPACFVQSNPFFRHSRAYNFFFLPPYLRTLLSSTLHPLVCDTPSTSVPVLLEVDQLPLFLRKPFFSQRILSYSFVWVERVTSHATTFFFDTDPSNLPSPFFFGPASVNQVISHQHQPLHNVFASICLGSYP